MSTKSGNAVYARPLAAINLESFNMKKNSQKQFDRYLKKFDSLNDCIQYIQQNFPQDSKIIRQVIDEETGKKIEKSIPAFLYRGEEYAWPTTVSSNQRIEDSKVLTQETKDKFRIIGNRIDSELQNFSNLSPMYSAAYLQHYGLPTELLDITSDLDIAAYFASTGNIGETGLICVFSLKDIHTKSIIIDLTNHPSAERPRRQSGYAFFHKKFTDIKEKSCIKELNLKWFSFTLQEEDIKKFKVKDEILNAYSDKVAGVIQLIVDDFEKQDDETAKWLAEKIVPAPFIGKIIDYWEHEPEQPRTFELVSMEEANYEYNDAVEKTNNYRKWSLLFPEIRPHKLKYKISKYPLE